jgi:serine/threonine protein kinase
LEDMDAHGMTIHRQKDGKFFGSIQTELDDISKTTVNIGTSKLEGVTFVESISLAYFDSSSLSNSLNVSKKGLLFVATDFGDHGLYQFERVAIPDDDDGDGVATFNTTNLMTQEHPIMGRNKTVILKSEPLQNAWIDYASSLTQLGKALHHRGIAMTLEQALLNRPFLMGHFMAMDDLALFVALGWPCALAEKMETSSKFQYYSCTIRLINTVAHSQYVSPKIINNKRQGYDFRCDIWSLGVVVYLLLGGYPSIEGIFDQDAWQQTIDRLPRPKKMISAGPSLINLLTALLSLLFVMNAPVGFSPQSGYILQKFQIRDNWITGIYDTLKCCAVISKAAGGIGLSLHMFCAEEAVLPYEFVSRVLGFEDQGKSAFLNGRSTRIICCLLVDRQFGGARIGVKSWNDHSI